MLILMQTLSAGRFVVLIHVWCRCEPFPTYARTYDMLHANGLLSHLGSDRCSMRDLFLEMDRILRPEVSLLHPFYPYTHARLFQEVTYELS